MVSALHSSGPVRALAGVVRCVLSQDTLLSWCLSLRRRMYKWAQVNLNAGVGGGCDVVASHSGSETAISSGLIGHLAHM